MCRFSVIMLSITLAETRLLTNRPVVAKTRRTLEGRPTIVDRWSANPKLARNRLMGEVALRFRLGSSAIPSTITHKSLVVRLPLLPESPGCRLAGAASRAWQAPVRTPVCSPERETGTLKIGSSDMMCDVGNAAIKDAIANIARNREVLHFLSCIARFLEHFSGLPTTRQTGFPPRNAPNCIRRP